VLRTPLVLVCGQGDVDGVVDTLGRQPGTVIVRHRFDGQVVLQDATTGASFRTCSTITSARTIDWVTEHGVHTYPLVVVDVSAASHPFWTGTRRHVDAAGQVEKFRRRYG
jgi:large subunit ribosomal protein L31